MKRSYFPINGEGGSELWVFFNILNKKQIALVALTAFIGENWIFLTILCGLSLNVLWISTIMTWVYRKLLANTVARHKSTRSRWVVLGSVENSGWYWAVILVMLWNRGNTSLLYESLLDSSRRSCSGNTACVEHRRSLGYSFEITWRRQSLSSSDRISKVIRKLRTYSDP